MGSVTLLNHNFEEKAVDLQPFLMIESFSDEYRFLSNFYPLETSLEWDGLKFITTEHAYVAMKTTDFHIRQQVANHPLKGLKKFGRSFKLRKDWDDIKLDVMLTINRYKYSKHNPTLRNLLLSTGDMYIQEGNTWKDTFWGVDLKTGIGYNMLGKILMRIRGEIRNECSNSKN